MSDGGATWRPSTVPRVALMRHAMAVVGDQLVGAQSGLADLPAYRPDAVDQGSGWVTSFLLSPVRLMASGIPEGSVSKWCLEPVLPRSTGDGRVKAPLEDGASHRLVVRFIGGASIATPEQPEVDT